MKILTDPAFRDVAREFVAAMPDRVSKLRQAVADDDLETARVLAHQLIGAGGSYGCADISAAAERLRLAIDAGQLRPLVREAVEELAVETVKACNAFHDAPPTA